MVLVGVNSVAVNKFFEPVVHTTLPLPLGNPPLLCSRAKTAGNKFKPITYKVTAFYLVNKQLDLLNYILYGENVFYL